MLRYSLLAVCVFNPGSVQPAIKGTQVGIIALYYCPQPKELRKNSMGCTSSIRIFVYFTSSENMSY